MKPSLSILSSSRADYNFLFSIIKSLKKSSVEIDFILLISQDEKDRHSRIEELASDGFPPNCVISYDNPKSQLDNIAIFSEIIRSLEARFLKERPSQIVLFGDRIEIFAAAFVAFILDISIIHIAGGEVSLGSKDNAFRKMISNMADLHVPISQNGYRRLQALGVKPDRLFYAGDPSQDNLKTLLEENLIESENSLIKYGLESDKITIIFVFHPVTLLRDYGIGELRELLAALRVLLQEMPIQLVITDRNSDFAPKDFDELLETFILDFRERIVFIPNLGRRHFIRLLSTSHLLIGNSSSAFYEASYLGVPSLSIGARQSGRDTTPFVKFVPAQNETIQEAIRVRLLEPKLLRELKFTGDIGAKIVNRIIDFIDAEGTP